MSDDRPILSDTSFRGGSPFSSLDRARQLDLGPVYSRFDQMVGHGEDSGPAGGARAALTHPSRNALLEVHRRLFPGRDGAGALRSATVVALYPGQDCPEPEFIPGSLENLETWLGAESIGEMHPIEQTALTLTRLVDIWPFDFGNRTTAIVFSNYFLVHAGYPPFFILPSEIAEFEEILSMAIRMQTEPLVRAIYRCMERELDLAGL